MIKLGEQWKYLMGQVISAAEMDAVSKIRAGLLAIGLPAEIVREAGITIIRGLDRSGKPFRVRVKLCHIQADLDTFSHASERFAQI